jgi:hypothetical protein
MKQENNGELRSLEINPFLRRFVAVHPPIIGFLMRFQVSEEDDAQAQPEADLEPAQGANEEESARDVAVEVDQVIEADDNENTSATSNCAEQQQGAEAATGEEPTPPPDAPKPRKKAELMDVDTARAVLAEPFDEAAEVDRPIPNLFDVREDGSKAPLDGVLSIFITGTSLELLKCSELAGTEVPHGATAELSKETILGDVQFRGAISDFYAYKAQITDADLDPLVLRVNATDMYGDGNNFELVVAKAALDVGKVVDEELQRRNIRDEKIARRRLAERSLPLSARDIKVLPAMGVS